MKTCAIHLILFLSLFFSVHAVTGLTPQVEIWNNDITGNIVGSGGLGRGVIAKKGDNAPGFGMNLHILGFSSKITYQPIDYRTSLNVQSNFTFDGQTYLNNDNLNFQMDWNTWDWSYRFINTGAMGSNFNFLAGLQWIDAAVSIEGIRGAGAAPTSRFDETLPLPYVGFETDIALQDAWRLVGSFKILELSLGGNELSFQDAELGIRYLLDGESDQLGSIFLGYRKRNFDVTVNEGDLNEAHVDFELGGFVGAFRFHW